MANTITQTTISANLKKVVKHIMIESDGSEETDLVIYDSSAVATTLGIADPLKCTVLEVRATACAPAAQMVLQFDATTDVAFAAICPASNTTLCFKDLGGLKNTAGSGITGDITLTTLGLAAGDQVTIVLEVRPG